MGQADRRHVLSTRRPAAEWDDDDVRVRPTRRSRPRTKIRPAHANAQPALVLAVDRGRYTCQTPDGTTIIAMRARELGRRAIAVGDQVQLVGDISGRTDTLARIVRIEPRRSVLRRSADDVPQEAAEKVIVANADQLLIVAALADPLPRTGFVDRCLVAAYTGGLEPMLLLTKADLAEPDRIRAHYADVELPILICGLTKGGLDTVALQTIRRNLAGQSTVLIGHSGVGKSTLVNALVPDAGRAIGTVTAIGKGRHTSTSAIAMPLPGGGYVIDTPGVRSFGLAHVRPDDLLMAFDDLVPGTTDCDPGCDHLSQQTCALDAFVSTGGAKPARLASFRRLLTSRVSD